MLMNSLSNGFKINLKRKFHDHDVKEVIDALLGVLYNRETKTYENRWVSYGKLKKYVHKELASKLNKAVDLGLIKNNNEGEFQFVSETAINLSLVSLDKKRYDDL